MLPSFSSYTVSKCFLTAYLVPHLSTFCFLVILLHEMAPKYTAEGLYSVPQCKVVRSLREKICLLDQLHSGTS